MFSANLFSAACNRFVESEGKSKLHTVPSADEASSVKPLQVVVKTTKRKFIFMEKARFETTDFQITDIMTDNSPLKVQPVRTTLANNYNDTTMLSLTGKFVTAICKKILDVELGGKVRIVLSIQFGEVVKYELREPRLLETLGTRHIDMDHPLIKRLKDNRHKTLCIITGVATLDTGGTIHKVTEMAATATLEANLMDDVSASGNTVYGNDRNLGLPPGTPVAYNLHELDVDINNGATQLVLSSGSRGGFSYGEDEVDSISVPAAGNDPGVKDRLILEADLQRTEEMFRPMFDLPDARMSQLQEDLLFFLSIPRDIGLLADIISREDSDQPTVEASELENTLLSPRSRWISLLDAVGFTQQDDELVTPAGDNAMSDCIGLLLDAATLLEDDTLDLLRRCAADLAQPLCSVLKDGILGRAASDRAVVQPVIDDASARQLLYDLQFQVLDTEIKAPEELTGPVDAAYCLLYGLWGHNFSKK